MLKRSSRRRERPLVLVNFVGGQTGRERFYERAAELGWQLLDLHHRRGDMPSGIKVRAAMINVIPTDDEVATIMKLDCPVVRIGRLPHPMDPRVPAVMPDMPAAGRMAAEHFAERGFKHVGYVGQAAQDLYSGFKARASELGAACHLLDLNRKPNTPYAERYLDSSAQFSAWLSTTPKPLGLLGFCDAWAAELCNMCSDAGLSIPEEVALLGYGNASEVVNCTFPPLSAVVPDSERIMEVAVDLLQSLMKGDTLSETTVKIPPKGIVTRASTDTLAVKDPIVAHAMRFMWDHLDLDLSVDDVAREMGVPRYRLERSFRTCLNRGVNAELRRKRIEKLCHLLRTTDDPIAKLAPIVGFSSPEYLHSCFRKDLGMTPRQYRKSAHERE